MTEIVFTAYTGPSKNRLHQAFNNACIIIQAASRIAIDRSRREAFITTELGKLTVGWNEGLFLSACRRMAALYRPDTVNPKRDNTSKHLAILTGGRVTSKLYDPKSGVGWDKATNKIIISPQLAIRSDATWPLELTFIATQLASVFPTGHYMPTFVFNDTSPATPHNQDSYYKDLVYKVDNLANSEALIDEETREFHSRYRLPRSVDHNTHRDMAISTILKLLIGIDMAYCTEHWILYRQHANAPPGLSPSQISLFNFESRILVFDIAALLVTHAALVTITPDITALNLGDVGISQHGILRAIISGDEPSQRMFLQTPPGGSDSSAIDDGSFGVVGSDMSSSGGGFQRTPKEPATESTMGFGIDQNDGRVFYQTSDGTRYYADQYEHAYTMADIDSNPASCNIV